MDSPRRSTRDRKPSGKALERSEKETESFDRSFSLWQGEAAKSRVLLCTRSVDSATCDTVIVSIVESFEAVQQSYDQLQRLRFPFQEETRRYERAKSLTSKISDLALSAMNTELDPGKFKELVRSCLSKRSDPSIFGDLSSDLTSSFSGSTFATRSNVKSNSSRQDCGECVRRSSDAHSIAESTRSSLSFDSKVRSAGSTPPAAAKHDFSECLRRSSDTHSIAESTRSSLSIDADSVVSSASTYVEAEAELAASRVRLQSLQKIAEKKAELASIEAQAEVDIAAARVDTYSKLSSAASPLSVGGASPSVTGKFMRDSPLRVDSAPFYPVERLCTELKNGMELIRHPVPEPVVFDGDPAHFPEFRRGFLNYIARGSNNMSVADKLHYLKKFTSGHARSAIEGFLFRDDESAFDEAWARLTLRFGDPNLVRRSYRAKIADWPKISSEDSSGLRKFADFLQCCRNIDGLEVLEDCEEIRRMTSKIPEHLHRRWSRKVGSAMMSSKCYPSFGEFCEFLSFEAEVACCHGMTSLSPYGKETPQNKTRTMSTSQGQNMRREEKLCACCGQASHPVWRCESFLKLKVEERRDVAFKKWLCYKCLQRGHKAADCKSGRTERHVLLKGVRVASQESAERKVDVPHLSSETKRTMTNQEASQEDVETDIEVPHVSTDTKRTMTNQEVTSMVVPIYVSSDENEVLVYALLDYQSDASYITQECADALRLHGSPVILSVNTMSNYAEPVKSELLSNVKIRGFDDNHNKKITINKVFTYDRIPADRSLIPTCETAKQWPHLRHLSGKMPPLQDVEIGMLIGYNCLPALAPLDMVSSEDETMPFAIKTELGWSIVGGKCSEPNLCLRTTTTARTTPIMSALQCLEKDFKDEDDTQEKVSQEDRQFLKILSSSINQREDGHLEMALPFKERPRLSSNYTMAQSRLDSLKRRFARDSTFKSQYVEYMEGIISRGEAEVAPLPGKEDENWLIPHHGVKHPRKPDETRVVFDLTVKSSTGRSLNEYLLSGPDLTNSLVGVLLRSRLKPILLTCDLQKMFHRFYVREEDRDYLRFLWWPGGDVNLDPVTYRMKVHLFGAKSSPGCANFGLKYLAGLHKDEHPDGAHFIQNEFYVDDGMTSKETISETIKTFHDAKSICSKGSIVLHKVMSNSPEVMEHIPEEDRVKELRSLELGKDELPVLTMLGIKWDAESDNLFFELNSPVTDAPTRRIILSIVAAIFDPLGWLSPFTLIGKSILQSLCRKGIGWDDSVGNELTKQWREWTEQFVDVPSIKMSRYYFPDGFGPIAEKELHHFSDGSTKGYGQCSYIRARNSRGDIHCALLISKSRVAPSRIKTIPRLELTAAAVSVKISCVLQRELQLNSDTKEYFHTDSKVVLGYINNEARRFHTFVANRVETIRSSSVPEQWTYVPSADNPADLASRGASVTELVDSSWFTGPSFLWDPDYKFTCWNSNEVQESDVEVRRTLAITTKESPLIKRFEKFSDLSRLIRAVARLQRLAKRCISKELTSQQEREDALSFIVKTFQEYELTGDTISKVGAYKDELGCWKVGGRLQASNLSSMLKHPYVLVKSSHLAVLVVRHYHTECGHQGRTMTLNAVVQHGFHIVKGHSLVSSILHRCVICRKKRSKYQDQLTAPLPSDRTDPSPPFSYCGMDCFGPFYIKNGRRECKRYGLIAACSSSRGVHVEALDDMTTDALINALRCLIAIRGKVRLIRCDQGSNLVGAKNEFAKELKNLDEERIREYLATQDCDFHFNSPEASHQGGAWERPIRSVRAAMEGLMQVCPGRLDDSSFRTLLYESMSIVNSRPLGVVHLENDNIEPLTPNHILTMKSSIPLPPPGSFEKADMCLRKRWRRVQYLAEQFWCRWRKEYLQDLNTQYGKWKKQRRNLQVNDVVLMSEPNVKRNEWPLGIVVKTFPGVDGLIRRVRVEIFRGGKKTELERPIHKLVFLFEDES